MYVLDKLVNQTIRGLQLSTHRVWLTFLFDTGPLTLEVVGDCCSSAWIEHLELPTPQVSGLVITDWVEFPTVDITDMPLIRGDVDQECCDLYQVALRTDRGNILLEFRNTSNGYYGANVRELVITARTPRTRVEAYQKHLADDKVIR